MNREDKKLGSHLVDCVGLSLNTLRAVDKAGGDDYNNHQMFLASYDASICFDPEIIQTFIESGCGDLHKLAKEIRFYVEPHSGDTGGPKN